MSGHGSLELAQENRMKETLTKGYFLISGSGIVDG